MGEIGTIFQNAILYVAGSEGLEKFGKAGYDTNSQKLLRPDGSLDLPQLMNILLDVFPEEQASAITDNVLASYVERAGGGQKKAQVIVDGRRMDIVHVAHDEPYEENLSKYLETDASDVRDIINEARRIRMSMGKPIPAKAPEFPEEETGKKPPARPEPEKPKISLVAPFATAELSPDAMESEIRKFTMARKAYTSVDIMDFIRYLKDKGYHFQENIVLENVYTRLEERKSMERAALMADIVHFLKHLPWPTESEVSAFIEMKKREGITCDGSEIKRMILVEMIRKN